MRTRRFRLLAMTLICAALSGCCLHGNWCHGWSYGSCHGGGHSHSHRCR